jgi:hypothetical protein
MTHACAYPTFLKKNRVDPIFLPSGDKFLHPFGERISRDEHPSLAFEPM